MVKLDRWASWSGYGAPIMLDGRRVGDDRIRIERCPSCGYCSPNLATSLPVPREFLASATYQQQLGDKHLPEGARRFLCWALIAEESGSSEEAAFSCLRAAWDCAASPGAEQCRRRALESFRRWAEKDAKTFPRGLAAVQRLSLLADIWRRIGGFTEARSLLEQAQTEMNEATADGKTKTMKTDRDWMIAREMQRRILRFQEHLVKTGNRGEYSVDQASRFTGG